MPREDGPSTSASNVVYGVEIGGGEGNDRPQTAGRAAEKAQQDLEQANDVRFQPDETADPPKGREEPGSTGLTEEEARKEAQFQSLRVVQQAGKTADTVGEQAEKEGKSDAKVREERHAIGAQPDGRQVGSLLPI